MRTVPRAIGRAVRTAADGSRDAARRGASPRDLVLRDEQVLEIDFVVPAAGGPVWLVEAKAGRTVAPAMAAPMQRPLPRLGDRAAGALLVHRRDARAAATAALAEGVAADGFELLAEIAGKARRRR